MRCRVGLGVVVGVALIVAIPGCFWPADPIAGDLPTALTRLDSLKARSSEFDESTHGLRDVAVGTAGDDIAGLDGTWVRYSSAGESFATGGAYSDEETAYMEISTADQTIAEYTLQTTGTSGNFPPSTGLSGI